MSRPDCPFPAFSFQVDFARAGSGEVALCRGGFSECTGLEATMEAKVIRAGGQNYGANQRAGQVTFGTVVLKRGMTSNRDLWSWFSHVNQGGKSSFRLDVTISVFPPGDTTPALRIHLSRALPVKLKCADLSAKASEVAVEELHLVHEGLTLE
jgi:phage tail-like protein